MLINRRKTIKCAILALAGMHTVTLNALTRTKNTLASATQSTWLNSELNATIPTGSTLRIIAKSNTPVLPNNNFLWHDFPDGGACFSTHDSGWIYVSNCEKLQNQGGASAIRFNKSGQISDAYSILKGTNQNCAGGKTPWGSWLSCEENGDDGQVYECDPTGKKMAKLHPSLGSFNHEAAAIDPHTGQVFMTEDMPDGCLYRFTPDTYGDLSKGELEVAVNTGMRISWHIIKDVYASSLPLRFQSPNAARFQGGEGILYSQNKVIFTTKHDNRVWSLNLKTSELDIIYDATLNQLPGLSGVDNIEVSQNGELLIAEDGGSMQLVVLGENYEPLPLVQLHGQNGSEIAGPAFSPDGTRLYFSSQRGIEGQGITYELTLPYALNMTT